VILGAAATVKVMLTAIDMHATFFCVTVAADLHYLTSALTHIGRDTGCWCSGGDALAVIRTQSALYCVECCMSYA
jgi:hypothetical protein